MTQPDVYSLADIARESGEPPVLIGMLLVERSIPHKQIGTVKVLDSRGRSLLLKAIAEFREKSGPVASRNTRPRRKAKREPAPA